MEFESEVAAQLRKMHLSSNRIFPIRIHDGIGVYRFLQGGKSLGLKYYDKAEYQREIQNYAVLESLGIPTLPLLAQTDRAIVMEDVETSPRWRLGEETDLCDTEIACSLAGWYRLLHGKGYAYLKSHLVQ